jgi:hypothetical protein
MGYTEEKEEKEVGRVKLGRLVSRGGSEPEILKLFLRAKRDVGHSLLDLTLSFPDQSSNAGANYMPKNLITLDLNSRIRIPKNASSTPQLAGLESCRHRVHGIAHVADSSDFDYRGFGCENGAVV